MCGVFGLVFTKDLLKKRESVEDAIKALFTLSEQRGRESAGLVVVMNNRMSVYKEAISPKKMLGSNSYKKFLSSALSEIGDLGDENSISLVGHTRLVTNGSQVISENNQPIKVNKVVGVHNGIVTNDQILSKVHLKGKRTSNSDTEILFSLIDKLYEKNDIKTSVSKVYKELEGSASIAFFCDDAPLLTLATNTGSLYYCIKPEDGFFVFASEKNIVNNFLSSFRFLNQNSKSDVKNLNANKGLLVNLDDIGFDEFSIHDLSENEKNHSVDKKELYKFTDLGSKKKNLRLCTKCVLPETYPFIKFNDEGVCNYCLNYEKQKFLGRESLERELEKHRSNNGNPDCIVGFSGGRDSSYSLHVLKKEFGMNPIAYSYDWGMITDLARRNQALVCGKLGIEHIIRAADIHDKRRYIRKNIYAWLKRPSLGMVPIFMAGDKMFYEYGRRLKKETGINLTIFGAGQQLEQMEFKVGFCGIDQTLKNNTKLSHFNKFSKIKLASWYIKEFLINPYYINESFFDSILSFYYSFLGHDDFLYLFRYLPWDEKLIDNLLRDEYKWESDERYGKNQWRMGDGHTAFIDYIYHTLAGFSEFDNFRCNQIREGLLTREEAVEHLREDNKPKMEVLNEFSKLVGFNLEEVLLKINSLPKMY